MKNQDLIVEKIVMSLKNDSKGWTFGTHTAEHTNGFAIWIANTPLFDTEIYKPLRYKLTMKNRLRVMSALHVCRENQILELLK